MRPRGVSGRRVLAAVVLVVVLLMLVLPAVGVADTIGNISPAPAVPAGGWMGRYPISRYQINQYFPAISVSLLGGINVSGLMPMVAYAAAQVIWLVLAFVSYTVITVFQLAFNLNLLTGEGADGGALAPVAQAIHHIYASTFGQPWLIAAICLVGIWAMWKALVQRRYTQTATALATSLIYCVVALGIVANPAQTITPLSELSNEMSRAFLSLASNGTVSEGSAAEQASSGRLFQTLVLDPWTVLEFGGIEHCTTTTGTSVAVQPLSRNASANAKLSGQLEETSEITAEGKRCINNREKYAPHFLAYPFESAGRNAEYEALKAGEDAKLPSSDPAKSNGTYPLGKADESAAEAAGKGNQYERLLITIVLAPSELGIWLLLGALCAGVILAQILLLLWLMFAPVMLIAAVFPGRGHAFFTGWVQRLLGYLARKAIYSLILVSLLAVCQALQQATSNLGWLMSFLLQAIFCWWVLMQRHQLTGAITQTLTGSPAAGEQRGIGGVQRLIDAGLMAQLAGLRAGRQPPASGKTKPKPQQAATAAGGTSTPTSTVSRPSTQTSTPQTSQPATRTPAAAPASRLTGAKTSTRPTSKPQQTPPAERAGNASAGSADRAGATPQRPAAVSPSSRSTPQIGSATPTRKTPPPAASSTTPTAKRTRKASTTSTASSRWRRAASQTSTPLPRPVSKPRRPSPPPPNPASVKPGSTTPTSAGPRPAATTTTTSTSPAPRQADRPTREAK
jgi:hypothetical protein